VHIDPVSGSRLFVINLPERCFIECAIINHKDQVHICMSTQVGCPVGCKHCATTYSSPQFIRSLSTQELISMVEYLLMQIPANGLPIILSFSGHGEPLLNWKAVYECSIYFIDKVNRLYATTVGIKSTMKYILEVGTYIIDFYLSLHGSSDKERDVLIPPFSERATISDLFAFASEYLDLGGRIVFNYILTDYNSTDHSLDRLANCLNNLGRQSEIRLAGLNNIGINTGIKPPVRTQEEILHILQNKCPNMNVRISQVVGNICGVACGQLRAGLLDTD